MAAETPNSEIATGPTPATTTTTATAISTEGGIKLANGYTKLPNGVVLDREGKPCRSCTSKSAFSTFAAQAKNQSASAKASSSSPAASSSHSSAPLNPIPRSDCPPDVEALGRSSWTLLHSVAAAYPERATPAQQGDLSSFVRLFSRLYPCGWCAEDFQAHITRESPRVGGRDEFGRWLCGAHNEVNRKLGKPAFDCDFWQERWVTGPKDGSCD